MVKWQVSKSYCPSNEMRKSGDLLIDFQNKNTQKKKEKEKNSRNESSMAFKKYKKAQRFLHLSMTIICFTTDLQTSDKSIY